jgi:hypothetical protein
MIQECTFPSRLSRTCYCEHGQFVRRHVNTVHRGAELHRDEREATRKRGDCRFAALVRRGTVSTSISRLFTSPAKTRLLRRQRQLALNRSELFLDTIEPAGS